MISILSNPLWLALIILAVITIILIGVVISLHHKMRRFLISTDSQNIGDSLAHVSGNLKELQEFKTELETYLTGVEKRLHKSIQSVHTVRFNPFKGTGGGGNQSFATTLLNEDGDGVVISSLYSRDHVSVFSKPVVNKSSEYELSDEERESLAGAVSKLR